MELLTDALPTAAECPALNNQTIADEFFRLAAMRPVTVPDVYPGYIATQVKKGLAAASLHRDAIVAEVGRTETIGDCRYAMTVTDFNGQQYRVTVEVLADKAVRS
jgi:hypothetical protein